MAFEDDNPFITQEFSDSLINSQVIGEKTGWYLKIFQNEFCYTNAYIKTHSYGEYIFDWQWAHAYEQNNLPYYPKLVHAIPFTPVNSPKIIGGGQENKRKFIREIKKEYLNSPLSSHHYLFIDLNEVELLSQEDYLIRDSIQFHWKNEWQSFEHFLDSLKMRKRKMIKKERLNAQKLGLRIEKREFHQLTGDEVQSIFRLYLETIDKKQSNAYLNQKTFELWTNKLSHQGFVFLAYKERKIVAMSLFFHSSTTLYGRYWGCDPLYQSQYLHFEMCYYLGIDYCIENKLSLFEAGAQGEQKLLRGFRPVVIKSAHHFKHPQYHSAIEGFIKQESLEIGKQLHLMEQYLPYKNSH